MNYGIVGNCRSAALINKQGTIEWLCLPDFDSPSIFASILDTDRGGSFGIECSEKSEESQYYLPGTNILATRVVCPQGEYVIYDYMPRYKLYEGGYHYPPEIVRYLKVLRGKPKIKVHYDPRLVYSRYQTSTKEHRDYLKSYTKQGRYESIYLYSNLNISDLQQENEIELTGDAFFLLSYNQKIKIPELKSIELNFERTKVYWMGWVSQNKQFIRFTEQIERSALVLKLLTYQRSGAIIAAATTSLPETVGSIRNWDYRYCWIRDASMTIRILTQIGHDSEAQRFLNFILRIIPYKQEKMQIMYGINGQKTLKERELTWLAGYKDSRPVRVGNAAYKQKQNDIFGILLDVIHQNIVHFHHAQHILEELWTVVRTLVRHIINNWKTPDRGIWEIRSEHRHFTFSKVLSWVGMDRAVKIAQDLGQTDYLPVWSKVRDRIRRDIEEKGWNEEKQAFTQSYGSASLDAANLLMEHYHFLQADDPRYISTVNKCYDELCRDGLMYRYKNEDDFGLPTSSFTVCTFWMIRSLAQIGEREKAEEMFDKVLGYANHLGLFSEGLDFSSKQMVGNFPQAYSHLALIDAALILSDRKE